MKRSVFLNLALAAMAAHAQAAVQAWVQRYGATGESNNEAVAIAIDGHDRVFVTGFSYNEGRSSDFFSTISYSSGGIPLWTNYYSGPAHTNDYATAITVDRSNNVFVTGYSASTNVPSYAYACVTIKYSGEGVPLWTNRFGVPGIGSAHATGMATDTNGNIFVVGYVVTTNTFNSDYFTIKYSGGGLSVWTNYYNGAGNDDDQPEGIAVSYSGDVFVAGRSSGAGSSDDYAIIAYTGTGLPLWTNRYNGPGNSIDSAKAIAVDASGDVLVTGSSAALAGFPPNYDYLTIKYSSAGVALWTNRYQGPDSDYAEAIAVDNAGNVFVTGASVGNHYDYATVKYSVSGLALWTNRYDGPGNSEDIPSAAAIDGSGNFIVTGHSWGNSADYATVIYSGSGTSISTNRYNGAGNGSDFANAIAVDTIGNVFVTGYSRNGQGRDYATIKYWNIPPIRLEFKLINDQLILGWTNPAFGLQSAPAVAGTFTNIAGATSPYTNPVTGAQQFFRLISN